MRVWVWLTLGCLAACSGTCGGQVAEIETRSGEVQRDQAPEREKWLAAEPGDELSMGDGLRTGPKSVARLRLFPEGTALVEPNTVMRFLEQLPGQNERITVEEGVVELDATDLDLEVHTPRAIARVAHGTRIRISARDEHSVRFDVLVGRVTVDHDGKHQEVAAGSALDLAAQPSPPPTELAKPAEEPAAPEAAGHGPGSSGPWRADFALTRTESATIHAATLPVDVRIGLVPPCSEAPALEVAGSPTLTPARGAGHVVARLGAGAHRLRVRCGGKIVEESVLRVQRDPATMELPRSAQRVEVEADGRRYTVRYQNVLPVVSLTWPDAPSAPRYTLFVRRGGREVSYEVARPARELRGTDLGEGEYSFWFTAEPARRSAQGSLRIVFDNTARSAYLSSPMDGSAAQGETVPVAGAALLRSQVSVDGAPVVLDAQGRFRTEVTRNPKDGALAVRVSHPITGVHYYLRRLR